MTKIYLDCLTRQFEYNNGFRQKYWKKILEKYSKFYKMISSFNTLGSFSHSAIANNRNVTSIIFSDATTYTSNEYNVAVFTGSTGSITMGSTSKTVYYIIVGGGANGTK